MSNTLRSKYVPPKQQQQPTQKQIQPKLVLSDAHFPSLSTHQPKNTHTNTPISTQMNFKQIAESSKDLPDPAKGTLDIPSTQQIHTEPKEIYDLSAYVKLQERRQAEYDALYGEGAFVSDRLRYDRFDSASEHSNSSDEKEDDIHEDELMDY